LLTRELSRFYRRKRDLNLSRKKLKGSLQRPKKKKPSSRYVHDGYSDFAIVEDIHLSVY
jgi:hypothetical protein